MAWLYHVEPVKRKTKNAHGLNIWCALFCRYFKFVVIYKFFSAKSVSKKIRISHKNDFFQVCFWQTSGYLINYLSGDKLIYCLPYTSSSLAIEWRKVSVILAYSLFLSTWFLGPVKSSWQTVLLYSQNYGKTQVLRRIGKIYTNVQTDLWEGLILKKCWHLTEFECW